MNDLISPGNILPGYGMSAMDALRMNAMTTQLQTIQESLRSSFNLQQVPPTPPDDGQLHISVKRKRMKFNFKN